jgi:type I restriction enzyme S subunit
MRSDWKEYRLGELLEVKYGKDHKKLGEGNIPVYGTGGIMKYGNEALYTDESILIPRKGSLNNIYYINEPFWTVDTLFWTKIKTDIILPKFLFYQLSIIDFAAMNVGSAVPSMTVPILNDILISVPEYKEQVNITQVLESLDNKIANNNRINQTLEEMAQALFKSWFVDFEPVKAKMQAIAHGTDPQIAVMEVISGKTAAETQNFVDVKYDELRATADLFPDALVESELGLIPEGWGVQCLSEITNLIKRGLSPRYTDDCGVIVINQKCIRNHTIDFQFARLHDDVIKPIKNNEIFLGDILVNSTGVGTLGRLSIVRRLPSIATVDSHITIVRANNLSVEDEYLGQYLIDKESVIENMGEGSTGQTELKRTVLGELKIVIPNCAIQQVFKKSITSLQRMISNNEEASLNLIQLRDSLLPKLLLGELILNEK